MVEYIMAIIRQTMEFHDNLLTKSNVTDIIKSALKQNEEKTQIVISCESSIFNLIDLNSLYENDAESKRIIFKITKDISISKEQISRVFSGQNSLLFTLQNPTTIDIVDSNDETLMQFEINANDISDTNGNLVIFNLKEMIKKYKKDNRRDFGIGILLLTIIGIYFKVIM